jgi:hypothetical protein
MTLTRMKWLSDGRLLMRKKSFVTRLAACAPGGFYRDGMKALPLQVVTHDGCAWVALKETKAKPCHENKDDWQLLVRKGRDGDSYREKKEPEPVRLKADA